MSRLPHKTTFGFWHVMKHVVMSQSALPATRNEATWRLKPPKVTTAAELAIGTAIRPSRERLRTVADVNATSSEHTFHARVKREPLLRIREKTCYLRPWQALQLLRFLIRPVAGPLSQPDQGRRPYGPQPSGSRPWQKRGGECWGEREG